MSSVNHSTRAAFTLQLSPLPPTSSEVDELIAMIDWQVVEEPAGTFNPEAQREGWRRAKDALAWDEWLSFGGPMPESLAAPKRRRVEPPPPQPPSKDELERAEERVARALQDYEMQKAILADLRARAKEV